MPSTSPRKPTLKSSKTKPRATKAATLVSMARQSRPDGQAARIALSANGKVLGRPRVERGPMAQVQTRVPTALADYLKMLSLARLRDRDQPFRTMQKMFESLFKEFLSEKPWETGFLWRESQAVSRLPAGAPRAGSQWKQLNIQLPEQLARRIEITADRLKRSQSSFCFTGLCWWTGLYPPTPEPAVATPLKRGMGSTNRPLSRAADVGRPDPGIEVALTFYDELMATTGFAQSSGKPDATPASSNIGAPGAHRSAKVGWLQFLALCDLKKPDAAPTMVELSLSPDEIVLCLRRLGAPVPRAEVERLPRLLDALKKQESKYATAAPKPT